MTNAELTDLGNLAMDRCRIQVRRVLQLVEDDDESAALLIAISINMLAGAVGMLEQEGKRPHSEAVGIAMFNFVRSAERHEYLQAKTTAVTEAITTDER